MRADRVREDPVLSQIVDRLVDEFHPERIYLFGSMARGDAGPDSDYDFMVVVPETDEPGWKLAQRAHQRLSGIGVAKDVLVWTRSAFNRRAHLRASLPGTILREGVLLHADDPERAAEAKRWLKRAAENLRAARLVLEKEPDLTGHVAFHAQQVAEMSLRAFLAWHDVPIGKTHDIRELGQAVTAIDASLDQIVRPAEVLTPGFDAYRYPGGPPDPTLAEARASIDVAEQVLVSVEQRLSLERTP